MTNAEMTELFAVMRLNYRNAKMFEGGLASLAPTIKLWTTMLPEVDYWTGQRALYRLLRSCKYPPTIAEFKEAADEVAAELRGKYRNLESVLKMHCLASGKTVRELYPELGASDPARRVIDEMGGPDAMGSDNDHRWKQFEQAYYRLAKKESPAQALTALPGGRKELTK